MGGLLIFITAPNACSFSHLWDASKIVSGIVFDYSNAEETDVLSASFEDKKWNQITIYHSDEGFNNGGAADLYHCSKLMLLFPPLRC